jgi:endonuclease YncB( thermonuclease family)
MSRFTLEVNCPQCAGSVVPINAASSGLLSVAILECGPCRRQFEVTIRLSGHRTPEQVQSTEKRAVQRTRTRARARARASVGA